jgi:hypothetical protein
MNTLVELTEESLSEKYDLPDGVFVSQIRERADHVSKKDLMKMLDETIKDNKSDKPDTLDISLEDARGRLARMIDDDVLDIVDEYEEVIIAGGAVTASLTNRKCSDIDIYICTKNDRARTLLLHSLIKALKATKTILVRSKFAISFMSDGCLPFQIVLTSDCTPEQVLQHFDVDSCCFCYTNDKFFGIKRGLRALRTRVNIVDMDRRTYAYEYRLVKYYKRGFDILLPGVNFDNLSPKKLQEEEHGVALLARYDKIKSPFGIRSYYEEECVDTNYSPLSNIAIAYDAILRGKQPTTVGARTYDYRIVINEGKYPKDFIKWYITTKPGLLMKRISNFTDLLLCIAPEINLPDDMEARVQRMVKRANRKLRAFTLGPVKFTSSDEMRSICADNMTEKQRHDWLCLHDS